MSWRSYVCSAIVRVIAISLTGLLFLSALQGQEGESFQSLLQRTTSAFRSGHYEMAAVLFDALEDQFSEEEEYQSENLQKILQPMHGYSLLRAGRAGETAELFELFLDKYPKESVSREFILFHLARAYEQTDEMEKAIAFYSYFEKENPNRPEVALAALSRAELLKTMGRAEESINLFNAIYAGRASNMVRRQARLRALQASIDFGELDTAGDILLNTAWRIDTMPELAALAFSALRIGDRFLAENRYHLAVRCYRLVPPKKVLLKKQRERLNESRAMLRKNTRLATEPGKTLWDEYYTNLASRLETDLETLQNSEDYTAGFLVRFGQSLLLGDRGEEAWIVFQSLAENPEYKPDIRAEAHYRWILAARNLRMWDEALNIAITFQNRYPDSSLAPETIFLVAETYKELHNFEQAVSLLGGLMESYPDHRQWPRWAFTRGYCYTLDEYYPEAREEFNRSLQKKPVGSLQDEARLWHALTWFFEKNYSSALEELSALQESLRGKPLEPEVAYWRAATFYARKDYANALEGIDYYLKAFPGHQRAAQASVLRGDILMGQGELLGAAVAFAKVTPEAENLFPYAVFQTGKIYRAMEEFERMAVHFETYLAGADLEIKLRKSEALYWIGWAYEQLGQIDNAYPVYAEVLNTYGNVPEASEVQTIMKSFHRLHEKRSSGSAESFSQWLVNQREEALVEEKLTYYSRLSLYQADLYREDKRLDEASALMLETVRKVSIDSLGAEFLGRAGLLLDELDFPSAKDYFLALVERFPDRPERAIGYYGLGRWLYKNNQPEKALAWLEKLAEELPAHPIAIQGGLLQGKALSDLGNPQLAIERFEELLKLKTARGRPHAEALQGIGQAYRLLREPEKAIGYYQRIYTVYRAYTDLVSQSYLQSAELFEEISQLPAARDTLKEFLDNPTLGKPEERNYAQMEMARLESQLLTNSTRQPEEGKNY